MSIDKKTLRKQMKQARNEMAPDQVKALSEAICQHVINSDVFERAVWVFAYYPLGNEVDVRPIIEAAWAAGKQVAVPKVFGDDMKFFEIESFDELKEGTFGVMEPEGVLEVFWDQPLVLVPGVAFDRDGNRMGFGRGYYDRYLADIPFSDKMGISYGLQIADQVPTEETDVSLDYIATENGIWNIHLEDSMNYEEAMAFLEETKKYGSQLGLISIRNLMAELGNVQEQVPVVHIGGTNGKGSVGAMISSVMVEAGYTVGRFNTPDVFSYEEEFLMNGKPIQKNRLSELFTEVAIACQTLVDRGLPHPTRFEVETAAAFLWFYREHCSVALVEVGMGGETDATNLITSPMLSILVSISMDHMKFLGNELTDIARVKSGIIKQDCPVVVAEQKEEVLEVIREKCQETWSQLVVAEASKAKDVICNDMETSLIWDWTEDGVTEPVRFQLGVRGQYQVENAICALEALKVLKPAYPLIFREAVEDGLATLRWPGRFEQIQREPAFFLDGAHNEDAVKKLRKTLDMVCPDKQIIFIMGVLADKEYEKMIHIMFKPGDVVYTLTPPNPRALSAVDLATQLQGEKIEAIPCEKPEDAVSYALERANAGDVILAFGSLYYLSGIRAAYEAVTGKK